jgi:hypothetical protein
MGWRVTVSPSVVAARRGGSQSNGQVSQAAPPPESEPPVALNPGCADRLSSGVVRATGGGRRHAAAVDSTGKLIPDSTRVAEPSGYAALDSAAVTGSAGLKFAPGKRHGIPVATAFLQPVEFRQVGTTRTGTMTLPPPPAPPPAAAEPKPRPPAPPPPPPPPPPPRARPDTTKPATDTTRPPPAPPDTTKARPDTSGTTH